MLIYWRPYIHVLYYNSPRNGLNKVFAFFRYTYKFFSRKIPLPKENKKKTLTHCIIYIYTYIIYEYAEMLNPFKLSTYTCIWVPTRVNPSTSSSDLLRLKKLGEYAFVTYMYIYTIRVYNVNREGARVLLGNKWAFCCLVYISRGI